MNHHLDDMTLWVVTTISGKCFGFPCLGWLAPFRMDTSVWVSQILRKCRCKWTMPALFVRIVYTYIYIYKYIYIYIHIYLRTHLDLKNICFSFFTRCGACCMELVKWTNNWKGGKPTTDDPWPSSNLWHWDLLQCGFLWMAFGPSGDSAATTRDPSVPLKKMAGLLVLVQKSPGENPCCLC